MLKSASYLLHDAQFSTIRADILQDSTAILQDDSGMPFRILNTNAWRVTLYGRYTKPVPDFNYGYQKDLEQAYTAANPPELPFSYGYHWRDGHFGVMLALRNPTGAHGDAEETGAMIPNWIRDVLPAPFFTYGPKGLMWWQWLGLLALILISLALGRALGEVTRRILVRITRRTSGTWDDRLFARISGGIGLLWALAVFRTLQAELEFPDKQNAWLSEKLGALVVVVTFWMIWRSVAVLLEVMAERPWAAGNNSAVRCCRSAATSSGLPWCSPVRSRCWRCWAIRWRRWSPASESAAWQSHSARRKRSRTCSDRSRWRPIRPAAWATRSRSTM
jgi:hypothetical protein